MRREMRSHLIAMKLLVLNKKGFEPRDPGIMLRKRIPGLLDNPLRRRIGSANCIHFLCVNGASCRHRSSARVAVIGPKPLCRRNFDTRRAERLIASFTVSPTGRGSAIRRRRIDASDTAFMNFLSELSVRFSDTAGTPLPTFDVDRGGHFGSRVAQPGLGGHGRATVIRKGSDMSWRHIGGDALSAVIRAAGARRARSGATGERCTSASLPTTTGGGTRGPVLDLLPGDYRRLPRPERE